MTTFTRILLVAVMAVLVATGACLGLPALQSDDVPRAPATPPIELPDRPVEVQPLAPVGAFGVPADASSRGHAHPPVRPTGSLEVTLTQTATTTLPDHAGIGVLDEVSGSLLAWRALAADAPQTEVRFAAVPTGRHAVVFASEPRRARYGYWARCDAEVRSDAAARVSIPTHLQEVTLSITIPAGLAPIELPTLARTDDPRWYAGVEIEQARRRGQSLTLRLPLLGTGRYRLSLDGLAFETDDGDQILVVPGPDQITTAARRRSPAPR